MWQDTLDPHVCLPYPLGGDLYNSFTHEFRTSHTLRAPTTGVGAHHPVTLGCDKIFLFGGSRSVVAQNTTAQTNHHGGMSQLKKEKKLIVV